MPDTKRTLAELATLLADNNTEDISAQDIRDLMQSTHPESASGHIEVAASAPPSPFTGQAYYDSGQSAIRIWDGTIWVTFSVT